MQFCITVEYYETKQDSDAADSSNVRLDSQDQGQGLDRKIA